ncbi:MAG: DUF1269 domain-containing protein [Terriglobia bacterium]
MDRMLVVVFDNASKAYEGAKVLQELDGDGSISVYSHAVVVKNPDDTTTVRLSDDRGPLGTLVGTLLGSLIGLLGGPTGFAIGGAVGLVGGAAADLNKARIGDDFIVDVAKVLLPNRAAVVAEIEEDSTTPVDTRMEAIGGTVFRRGLSEVKHTIHDENIAAIKADLAQKTAEHAKADADRKAKLQENINELESKLQAWLEEDKDRRQAAEREAQAKAEILKAKAAVAKARAAETHI